MYVTRSLYHRAVIRNTPDPCIHMTEFNEHEMYFNEQCDSYILCNSHICPISSPTLGHTLTPQPSAKNLIPRRNRPLKMEVTAVTSPPCPPTCSSPSISVCELHGILASQSFALFQQPVLLPRSASDRCGPLLGPVLASETTACVRRQL